MTQKGLENTTGTVKTFFSSIKDISNAFGTNDGGNSGGVSVGGSAAGGTQSSGSGAGVAVDASEDDFWTNW